MIIGLLLFLFSLLNMSQDPQILSQVDYYREEQGLSPLIVSEEFTRVAQIRATGIAVGVYKFQHLYGGDSIYDLNKIPVSRLAETLSRARHISYVVPNLMSSPPHRAVLTSPKVTHVGIATVEAENSLKVVVIIIGTPLDDAFR